MSRVGLVIPLLILGSSAAFAGTWTGVRAGYTTGYDYPLADGQKVVGGPNPGAFTASLSVASDSRRWAPGLVASAWVFHVRAPSFDGPDVLRTSRLAMLGPVLRLTLGSPESRKSVYLEAGPAVVWMDVHIRNDDPGDLRIRESSWLAGMRFAGAVPILATRSGRFELGLEHLRTEDFDAPADSALYDLDGVKEWGVFLAFAW